MTFWQWLLSLFRPRPTPVPGRASSLPIPALSQADLAFSGGIVARINEVRIRNGLATLSPNPLLASLAAMIAADNARTNQLSHTGSDGSTEVERAAKVGYQWQALEENIAEGTATPDATMQFWINSPGHYRNIVNPSVTESGAAMAKSADGNPYWACCFGRPI